MVFLSKKNKLPDSQPQSKQIITEEKECKHKFQDFPWYIDYEIRTMRYQSDNILDYELKEPYVCIYCGLRKDKTLDHKIIRGRPKDEMYRILQEIEEKYSDRIKPKPIVEDMINDLQLVDVGHIRWYHYLNGTKDPSTSRNENEQISQNIKLKL